MTSYFRRLWPVARMVAKLMAIGIAIRFAIDYAFGDRFGGGSVANVSLRILVIVLIPFATGFAVAAVLDAYGRHLERKGRTD